MNECKSGILQGVYHACLLCDSWELTAAARAVYLQPAVSQAVRQLKSGIKLFLRTSRAQLTKEELAVPLC